MKIDQALIDARKDTKMLPDQIMNSVKVTCHALSSDFLIYGDDVSTFNQTLIHVFN